MVFEFVSVVASLAKHSATAVKEIEALVNTSVNRVELSTLKVSESVRAVSSLAGAVS